MNSLCEEFDKVIENFFEYLETEDEVYVGLKGKFRDWVENQTVSGAKTEQIKQHCQYTFKKGKMKDTLCLKKTDNGNFCAKHLPKKKEDTSKNSDVKKCIYVMTTGKRCSKNATIESEHCTVHLKKIANEETDFTVPNIPEIPELMG